MGTIALKLSGLRTVRAVRRRVALRRAVRLGRFAWLWFGLLAIACGGSQSPSATTRLVDGLQRG
jgi:hypothetical protein